MEVQQHRSGYPGWVRLGGYLMILGGALDVICGLVAVVDDRLSIWANRDVVHLGVAQWGWVQLILGAVVILAGIGVMKGNSVARAVGVVLVAASLWANLLFMPVCPVWSIVVIAIDTLVIWGFIVPGPEVPA